MNRTSIFAVKAVIASLAFLCLCTSCQRRLERSPATVAEKDAAVRAAVAFYDDVRSRSLVELPEVTKWNCADEFQYSCGQPGLRVWANLAEEVAVGQKTYDGLDFTYSLFHKEIGHFSLGGHFGSRSDASFIELSEEKKSALINIGKAFAKAHGSEYEFLFMSLKQNDTSCLVTLQYNRLVDGVNYLHDGIEIGMSYSGVVTYYRKSRNWPRPDSLKHKPIPTLEARAKRLATGTWLRGAKPISDPKRRYGYLAAGDYRRIIGLSDLSEVSPVESQLIYVSEWEFEAASEDGGRDIMSVHVYLDAHSGKLLYRYSPEAQLIRMRER